MRGIEAIEVAYDFTEASRTQNFDETDCELRLLGGWVLSLNAGQLVGEIGLAVSKEPPPVTWPRSATCLLWRAKASPRPPDNCS